MIHLKNSKHNLLITIYALLIDVFCNYFHHIFFLNYRVKLCKLNHFQHYIFSTSILLDVCHIYQGNIGTEINVPNE